MRRFVLKVVNPLVDVSICQMRSRDEAKTGDGDSQRAQGQTEVGADGMRGDVRSESEGVEKKVIER